MEEKLIKVTTRIMGEDYTIRGRTSEEHIGRIAAYVDQKMAQIADAYPKLGTSRVAVLAAINMADELFKIREQYEQLTSLLEEEWSQRHGGTSGASGRQSAGAGGRQPAGEVAAASDAVGPARQRQLSAFGEPVREPQPDEDSEPYPSPAATSRRLLTGDAMPHGRKPPGRPGWEPPGEGQ